MTRKNIGIVLAIVGALGAILSALADIIGFGSPPMGPQQIVAIVLGAVIFIVGIVLLLTGGGQPAPDKPAESED